MINATICDEAIELIAIDRHAQYGNYTQNLTNIATGWSIIFNTTIQPSDVAKAMVWLKLVRANKTYKRDTYVDAIAYLLMAEDTHTKTITPVHNEYETR